MLKPAGAQIWKRQNGGMADRVQRVVPRITEEFSHATPALDMAA